MTQDKARYHFCIVPPLAQQEPYSICSYEPAFKAETDNYDTTETPTGLVFQYP